VPGAILGLTYFFTVHPTLPPLPGVYFSIQCILSPPPPPLKMYKTVSNNTERPESPRTLLKEQSTYSQFAKK
jgi:hypothetical protein